MTSMARRHPIVMCTGALVMIAAVAARHRLQALVALCGKAERWAMKVHHDLREIAIEADTGRMVARELLSDGEASDADRRQIDATFERIARRALDVTIESDR